MTKVYQRMLDMGNKCLSCDSERKQQLHEQKEIISYREGPGVPWVQRHLANQALHSVRHGLEGPFAPLAREHQEFLECVQDGPGFALIFALLISKHCSHP